MRQVLVTAPLPKAGLAKLMEQCSVFVPEAPLSREELLERLRDVDAAIACAAVDAAMMDAAPKLQIISNYGAGYDRVDVAAATARGIPVTNIPETVAPSTAELAFGLLLAAARRIAELDHMVRQGEPEKCFGLGKHMGISLYRRKLGIVGMGNIGRIVAGMARAMGMQILYHNRTPLPEELAQGATWMPLDDLLRESDAVTIHCPLTPETQNLIDARRIALLRPDCVLVNAARGAIVDNDALAAALAEKRIAAAGIDVYPDEPHIPAAYLTLPNVVLTPHVGSNSVQARAEMAEACGHRILEVFAGRRPPNVVNPAIYEGGTRI